MTLPSITYHVTTTKSFSNNIRNYEVVESLLNESKFFIEWTAAEAEIDTAATLIDLQIILARWQYNMSRIWENPVQRAQILHSAP